MHYPQPFFAMKFCTNVTNRNKKNIIFHFSHILGEDHQNFKNQVSFSKTFHHISIWVLKGLLFYNSFSTFWTSCRDLPPFNVNVL